MIGKTLAQYQIIEELGRGGMAVVYRAYQPSLQRFVAIKVLPPQFTFDTTFIQRFQQEARAAARLEHPNIVTIHDVDEQEGTWYIVMQLLHGESLNRLIQREGQLPLERVAHIVAQIASALDYAHAQGFVHRDIKPGNIIVGPEDHATLTDFGIAKAAEGTRLTRTGTVMGTPEYMSPEQAKGEGVGAATDVYSLGIVTYEMLAGRVPFEADSASAILHKQAYERAEPVRTHAPHLPAAVEGVLNKALAKEPERRFRSAGELAATLRDVGRGRPVRHVREPEPPTIAAPVVGKKRPGWALPVFGGLAVLILVALAIFGLWSRGPTSTPSPTVIAAASETARPSPTLAPPTDTLSPMATAAAQDTPMLTPEPTNNPAPAPGKPQITTRHAVNVYSGPGNSYAKVGQTAEGQTLDVVARNPEGTWWRLCCVGGEAVWIEADLVDVTGPADDVPVATITPPTPTPKPARTPTPKPTRTPTPQKAQIVIDGTYNVRSGPGTDYDTVGQVRTGQTLDIVARNFTGTWWQICCVDGKQVWITASLVEARGPTGAVPVAASVPPTPTSQPRTAPTATPRPQSSSACRGSSSMPPVTLVAPRLDLTCNGPVRFSWEWPHTLQSGETFEIHIWPEFKQTRDQVKRTSSSSAVINLREDVRWIDWDNKPHRWEVVVVCKADGRWVSQESEDRLFYFWPSELFDPNTPEGNCH